MKSFHQHLAGVLAKAAASRKTSDPTSGMLALPGQPVRGMFYGLRIEVSNHLVIRSKDDWSRVRSPSRARRRLKRGFPQNIRVTYAPDPRVYRHGDTLFMHPETFRMILEEAERNRTPTAGKD